MVIEGEHFPGTKFGAEPSTKMAITLAELYIVSTGIGFCYVAWGFLAGQIGHAGDAGHGHGDHGLGHTGHTAGHHIAHDGGAGDAPDMSGGHSSGDAPDMSGGHSGSHGHGDGGDSPDMDTQTAARSAQAVRSSAGYEAKRTPNIVSFLLRILSPMTIAMFSFYFGMTGVFITRIMHLPDWIALLPALALGYLGMKATQSAMNFAIAKMRVSSNFSEAQIVGKTAQVSISIPAGKLGEIVYLVGQSRQTAPARTKPGVVLSKDSEVIITDVQDGVFYVEGWSDELIETTIETIPKPEKTPG